MRSCRWAVLAGLLCASSPQEPAPPLARSVHSAQVSARLPRLATLIKTGHVPLLSQAGAPLRSTATCKPGMRALFSMTAQSISARPGRNQPCHCGSGRKYKHCCLEKDQAQAAAARAQAAAGSGGRSDGPTARSRCPPTPARAPKPQTHQPWKATTSRGFIPRTRTPRKVGGS